MNELDRIDDYFSGRLSAEERTRFELALQTDAALTEAVAFYMIARRAAQDEAHARRKAAFEALRKETGPVRPLPLWTIATVAASILVILSLGGYWFFRQQSPSAVEQADRYIQEQYGELPSRMDGQQNRLQTGISRYNEGKFSEAGTHFDAILQKDPNNSQALQFAGLAALRVGTYDQAIDRFHRLGQQTQLYSNPGLLLEAIARLKRGQPTDPAQAKILLKTVVDQNLEGKTEAESLLKTF